MASQADMQAGSISDEETYEDIDYGGEPLLEPKYRRQAVRRESNQPRRMIYGTTIWFLIMTLIASLSILGYRNQSASPSCVTSNVRKEWRTLIRDERLEYLRAVKCLSSIRSSIVPNGTLHDEFAYIHSTIGDYAHEAAPFLPWHRYFIILYERTLQTQCQYSGTLPFWDWTIDWEDLTRAPVWDAIEGFGGNGDASTSATVGNGHCVTDGPFAGLELQYYHESHKPHCLSRGFLNGEFLSHFGSERMNTTAMETVLAEPDYYSFLLKLEDGPHSAVPIIVRGDFSVFTAPNDPIFFLHHAQIDRLWWEWQLRDIEVRAKAYNGPASHDSSIQAALTDVIEMHGLGPNIAVRSLMTLNSDGLCYSYENTS